MEENVESRMRIQIYRNDIENLQSKLNTSIKKIPKDTE
jgi:hypothetical protein